MVRLPLKLQTTTEIRGQCKSAGNGISASAVRSTDRAGLGFRSRRVIPNSQSSTSAPARYHSSVQENTNTPAHPDANAARTSQSSTWACLVSPCAIARPSRPRYWTGRYGPHLHQDVRVCLCFLGLTSGTAPAPKLTTGNSGLPVVIGSPNLPCQCFGRHSPRCRFLLIYIGL